MSVLRKGDRVRHVSYGEGSIEAKMVFDEWRVRFDLAPGLPRTARSCDLTLLSERAAVVGGLESATSSPLPPVVRPSRALPATELIACPRAWQTLEALRLGVVPAQGVEEYTVARAKELGRIRELLDGGRGCRVIWGEYGAGKTHMLDAAEQLALEQGWATARITLDPMERALHHPLRLYQKIASSLRTADLTSQGFEAILDRLVDKLDHRDPNGPRASRFFSPYLHVLHEGRDDQVAVLRDYVHGEKVASAEVNAILSRVQWRGRNALRMSDYRTYGRMYTHLIGTLASWCADAGTRGLALFFDEVERVDALEQADRHYAFEVLRHFAAVTMRPEHLAFDPDHLYKGGHAVHRKLPLRFHEDQPLAVIFALTPLEEIQQRFAGVTESVEYDLWLDGLSQQRVGELVRRIGAVYDRAYATYTVDESTLAPVERRIAAEVDGGHDSFRAVVRAAVFLLDADRCEAGPG